jgi:hypothetical protein
MHGNNNNNKKNENKKLFLVTTVTGASVSGSYSIARPDHCRAASGHCIT